MRVIQYKKKAVDRKRKWIYQGTRLNIRQLKDLTRAHDVDLSHAQKICQDNDILVHGNGRQDVNLSNGLATSTRVHKPLWKGKQSEALGLGWILVISWNTHGDDLVEICPAQHEHIALKTEMANKCMLHKISMSFRCEQMKGNIRVQQSEHIYPGQQH
jgi:hypothetical protein